MLPGYFFYCKKTKAYSFGLKLFLVMHGTPVSLSRGGGGVTRVSEWYRMFPHW